MIEIAQQPPFRMVDDVVSYKNNCIICKYQVKADNPMLHHQKLGAAGLIECLAQTAAAKSLLDDPDKPEKFGYLVTVNSFKVYKDSMVGDSLLLELTLMNKVMQFSIFTGKVVYQDEVIAEGEIRVFDND